VQHFGTRQALEKGLMNAYRKIAGILAVGALSCMALSPAFAQGHSSGGHSSSGGGGHSSSGGGGHSSSGGGGGGHAHYTSGGHSGYGGSYAGSYGRGSYSGRGGYYGRSGYYGHGGYGGRGGYGGWGHGYYGGFYGARFGFGWFLPVLPAFYATYWFGGIPYYYANDAYYTWSPDYNGYVMTDPPAGAAPANGNNDAAPPAPSGAQTYNYPKNGQTEEQQAADRYQCHQWAVSQSGYDPTRNAAPANGQGDYQRAMTACLEGRGYSVR
jgi:hypothetical protein